jgi:hypothetical protein
MSRSHGIETGSSVYELHLQPLREVTYAAWGVMRILEEEGMVL